jgi:two-component system, OmpR family, KDP operon response regulator KdpE
MLRRLTVEEYSAPHELWHIHSAPGHIEPVEGGKITDMRHFKLGDRNVDLEARLIIVEDRRISLTQIECRLLACLRAKPNRTIRSEKLVDLLWGHKANRGTHSLRTVIKNVRRKVEPRPTQPQYLILDRTIGYRLTLPT